MAKNWVTPMPWKACPKIAFLVTLVLAGIAGVLHSEKYLSGRARKIHDAAIVVDTHIDLPMQLRHKWADLSIRNATPHFDIPPAHEGGMTAAFIAIYVPAGFDETGGVVKEALELIDMVNLVVVAHSRDLEAATSVADIRRIKKTHRIAILMGLEGGHLIEDSIGTLRDLYRLGARYMTLTQLLRITIQTIGPILRANRGFRTMILKRPSFIVD